MDHQDHVALIRAGVEGVGPRWLELGAGEGAFTLALADVLGPGGTILAMDRDARALDFATAAVRRRFPGVIIEPVPGDFTVDIRGPAHDGVVAANSLHFVSDRATTLASIKQVLRPGGHLVIVEYDADRGNPWVPFPFSFDHWLGEAAAAGFVDIRQLHRVGSRFMGGIYGAVASTPSSGDRVTSIRRRLTC